MSIIRVERRSSFTTIPNDLVNDSSLRWQDLGVLVYLLSKPADWSISVRQLSSVRSMGVDGIREVMRRLRSSGYVEYRKLSTGDVEYIVSDSPSGDEAKTGKSLTGKKPNRENANVILKTDSDNKRLMEETNPPLPPAEPKAPRRRFDPAKVDLPHWMPRDLWGEWCAHRSQIREPITEIAAKKQIKFLDDQRKAGASPEEIVTQSIRNGWQGLFAVAKTRSGANVTRQQHHQAALQQHLASYDFLDGLEV